MSLTVVALGGLCNRLRALLSAQHLACQTGIPVVVEWGSNAECRAYFNEIFQPISAPSFAVTRRPWWNVPARKRNLYLPALLRKLAGYCLQHNCYEPRPGQTLPVEAWRQGKHYLSTGSVFYPYPDKLVRQLRLQPDLESEVKALCSKYTPYTVGVHIRRTDNALSISHSPIQAFRRAMEAEIAANPRVCFFLATDDENLKCQLQKAYPGRIIIQPTCVRRDTLQGIREAVVDLYCLAATNKLLGSYWSSFTDTAAELGQIPVQIVKA